MLLHLLVSNIEHLFDAVSADFVKDKWDTSVDKAAWLSSLNYALAIVLSPVVGYFMDAANARMLVAGCACLIVAAAHTVLGVTHVTPILGLLMLAVGECVLPTVRTALLRGLSLSFHWCVQGAPCQCPVGTTSPRNRWRYLRHTS